jgi:hypothetical protein
VDARTLAAFVGNLAFEFIPVGALSVYDKAKLFQHTSWKRMELMMV